MELVIAFGGGGTKEPMDAMSRNDYIALRVAQPLTADSRKRLATIKSELRALSLDVGDLSTQELDEFLFTARWREPCDCGAARPHTRPRPMEEFKVDAAVTLAEIRARRR